MQVIAAEAKALKITPVSRAAYGELRPLERAPAKTRAVAPNEPTNANRDGAERRPKASWIGVLASWLAVPSPAAIATVAPSAAPPETPSTNGSARGLRVSACSAQPDVPSAAPTITAKIA